MSHNKHTSHNNSCDAADECASSCSSRTNSSVRFRDITIREYNRTVGDNPSCTSGCPISIGWRVLNEISIPVDDYEQARAPRRGRIEMQIPQDIRQEMLMREWDISYSCIREAASQTSKDRERRRKAERKLHTRKFSLKRLFRLAKMRKISSERNKFLSEPTENTSSMVSTATSTTTNKLIHNRDDNTDKNEHTSQPGLITSLNSNSTGSDDSFGHDNLDALDVSCRRVSLPDLEPIHKGPSPNEEPSNSIDACRSDDDLDLDLSMDGLDSTYHNVKSIGLLLAAAK